MNDHDHDWQPDGESCRKTNHQPNCDYNENLNALARPECLQKCETYRVRRYTCHCGEMKEVKYR